MPDKYHSYSPSHEHGVFPSRSASDEKRKRAYLSPTNENTLASKGRERRSMRKNKELLQNVVGMSTFHVRKHKQIEGFAMGSSFAPLIAFIFMWHPERPSLSPKGLYFGAIHRWHLFVGKSLATLRHTRLNSAFPTIRLTSETPASDGLLYFYYFYLVWKQEFWRVK